MHVANRRRPSVDSSPRRSVIRLSSLDSDAAVVAAILEGDRAGGVALYDRHHVYVRRVLFRVLGPDGSLEDLVQDVFIAAVEALDRLEDPNALRGWLGGISVNLARVEIRKRKRGAWLRFLPGHAVPETTATVSSPELNEAVRAAYRAIACLHVEERVAFALRFIEGMELTEVATLCQMSLATTKRRLASARKKFTNIASTYPELQPWVNGGAP